jgi:hypothetical protein
MIRVWACLPGMPCHFEFRSVIVDPAADIILHGATQRSFPELDFALSGLAGSIETTS